MAAFDQAISETFGIIVPEEIALIKKYFEYHQIPKGKYFLRKQQQCDQLSFIQDGYLRIYTYVQEKEITQWVSSAGYFITELNSFFYDHPSRWHIQALEDTSLYSISSANYKLLTQEFPKWQDIEKYFLVKCFSTMEDRILTLLSLTAEERYQFLWSYNPSLFNFVPLQYIASMLGMTPETLSRIRKKQINTNS